MTKSRLWWFRARVETRAAVRTWFGTLTLRPEVAAERVARAIATAASAGRDWDTLGDAERFALIHAAVAPDLTKALKRVRRLKPSATLRYLLVAEAHKSGLPHYHVLLHELDPDNPVTWRELDGLDNPIWRLGFSKWRLVKSIDEATYVTKYVAKDAKARVRASLNYGLDALRRIAGRQTLREL